MTSIAFPDIALRLTLVVLLCGAIGLERESRDQPAGVRTHVLVGMGAAVFTLISAYGFSGFERAGAPIDPTRIAAQVVTGVGFLGAGAIIHQGLAVRGLTTAAAVWISAAIGMAAGIGFYSLAITGTAVVLVALLVFRHVRTGLLHRVQSDRFVLEVEVEPDRVGDMLALVAEHDAVLDSLDCEREGELTAVRLHLRVSPGEDRAALVKAIEDQACVASAHAKRGLELAA
ncbi:MgtC/SapB family protein [Solirubrobacter ginsenosidimutans]|uniref:MgtC/SapB family protein n=1 Tax=Solirubrobacter ginsenosidimutans TaxID=490573 RepID=A0A9X3MZU5_9ACTN|nr:MgtC/SapB family protein [Solirubrobacter ginsenosidimutans]MDA0164448.1 MgtC/SapB family protein [Solirubrobacter ginsenosidimutans]